MQTSSDVFQTSDDVFLKNSNTMGFGNLPDELDRVTGLAIVTGAAKYAAEYEPANLQYGVLVTSTIAKGKIRSLNTRAAERAAGVSAVISHLNSPPLPGADKISGLKIFQSERIFYNGQAIAVVVADTYERAVYAASLVTAEYDKEPSETDLKKNIVAGAPPRNARQAEYNRGDANAWKTAPVKIEVEYTSPIEVHNPMEMHSLIAMWTGEDKVLVYDKTQGVKASQRNIMTAFALQEQNVQVIANYVGGGFGSAGRTWPHVIATLLAAKKTGKPIKLILRRDQMFMMVGYRPTAIQKISLGADSNGKLVGMAHDVVANTASYEEFSEPITNITRFLYACPNVSTHYKLVKLDVSTPTFMRGPGETTGAYALESAMDELAHQLNMDPLEFRRKNYSETDAERNLPYSSKFVRECYQMGSEKIGWKNRKMIPGSLIEDGMMAGYGMGTGIFNSGRGAANAIMRLGADGKLVVQSAVSDSGPGTSTSMTQITSNVTGIPTNMITFQLGDSTLPPGPSQVGSTTTSTLGTAVHQAGEMLLQKIKDIAMTTPGIFQGKKPEELIADGGYIMTTDRTGTKFSYTDILKAAKLPQVEVTETSKAGDTGTKFSTYSYSVHFVKVHVDPATGMVKIKAATTVVDAGTIVSPKTARSQVIGAVTGGIGMALMEEGVIDHRYGRWVNNNFADYHIPVHADCPHIDALFPDQPDPVLNPIGSKGMGEVAIVGFAAAVANAVFNATGKRIRELPITPDKLI